MDRKERMARLARFDELFIETTGYQKATDQLHDLMASHGSGQEARCALLTGPTGAGKTSTLRQFSADFPMTSEALGERRPVVIVEVPAHSTLKNLAASMLTALGLHVPTRGSEAEWTGKVVHHLREQGVKLLILDEFQHLISRDQGKIAHETADWVKGLLNRNVCPIVLAGQPAAERVVLENDQLRRRTLWCQRLSAFDWNVEAEQEEFRAILDLMEEACALPLPSDLGADDDLALRIHTFAEGLVGMTSRLVRATLNLALKSDDAVRLSRELFAQVADELTPVSDGRFFNPFREENLEPLLIDDVSIQV